MNVQIVTSSSITCVMVSHLSYASRLLSSILITTFTVERFIGVVFPLRRSMLLTIAHARRIIGVEVLVCCLLATFTTFTIGIDNTQKQKLGFNGTDCDILADMEQVYAGFNVAFLVIGSIVGPIFVVTTLNAAILSRIVGRTELSMNAAGSISYDTSSSTSSSCAHPHWHHNEYNVTLVLLVVSTTFVVLNVPYCVCWFLLFTKVDSATDAVGPPSCVERQLIGSLHAAKYLASVPYYLNYGINFALYSMCARAFRIQLSRDVAAVRRLLTCRRSDQERAAGSGQGIEVIEGSGGDNTSFHRRLQLRRQLALNGLRYPVGVGKDELGTLRLDTDNRRVSARKPHSAFAAESGADDVLTLAAK